MKAVAPASMREEEPSDRSADPGQRHDRLPHRLLAVMLMLLGGITFGGLATMGMRSISASHGATPVLQAVSQSDFMEALGSIGSGGAGAAVADARACKAPLAFVTLVAAPGAKPGIVRIRSGNYLSPNILISDAPRRVAIPFPAPYPSGRGILAIEGSARDLRVWLAPSWQSPALNGSASISVAWTPSKPC